MAKYCIFTKTFFKYPENKLQLMASVSECLTFAIK